MRNNKVPQRQQLTPAERAVYDEIGLRRLQAAFISHVQKFRPSFNRNTFHDSFNETMNRTPLRDSVRVWAADFLRAQPAAAPLAIHASMPTPPQPQAATSAA